MRRTMPAAECIATDAEVIDDEQNLRQEQAWWYPVIDAFWMNRQCRCASVQRDTTWREIAGRSRPVDDLQMVPTDTGDGSVSSSRLMPAEIPPVSSMASSTNLGSISPGASCMRLASWRSAASSRRRIALWHWPLTQIYRVGRRNVRFGYLRSFHLLASLSARSERLQASSVWACSTVKVGEFAVEGPWGAFGSLRAFAQHRLSLPLPGPELDCSTA